MMKSSVHLSLIAAFGVSSFAVLAGVPETSPYKTDLIYSYNKDKTSDAISVVNTVACYVKNFAPEIGYAQVGEAAFIAQVDRNLCDSDAQVSNGEGGASSQPNYETATVQSSFQNNELTGKIWSASTENGVRYKLYVHFKMRGNEQVSPPYGNWEVYWCSNYNTTTNSCEDSYGYVTVEGSNIKSFDRWQSSNALYAGTSASNLTVSPDKRTGGGKFLTRENNRADVNGVYAFDTNHVLANLNGTEVCNVPNSNDPNARISPWETWLYDSETGQRVNRNAGFGLRDDNANWAWAGYWGVSIGNSSATNGQQLRRYDSSGNLAETYTVVVKPGKLRKIEVRNNNLSSMTNVMLKTWGQKSLATGFPSDTTSVPLYFKWDGQYFVFSAYDTCPQNGGTCETTTVNPRSVSIATLTEQGIGKYGYNDLGAWKDGSANNYRFILANWGGQSNNRTVYNADQVVVKERSETTVMPSDTTVPANLYCIGPDCAQVNGQALARGSNPTQAWSWSAGAGDNQGFMAIGGLPVDFRQITNFFSGPLLTNDQVALLRCTKTDYCDGEVEEKVKNYYRWTSSANSWDNYSGVKDGNGNLVAFEAPLNLDYTVPVNDTSSYRGRTVSIQYPGNGQLWVPGYCFNETTGVRVACGTNVPWAPEFVIPYDEAIGRVTDPATGRAYLVKSLRRGVYYPSVAAQNCANLSGGLPQYNTRTLPTQTDWKNPADPASPVFIGTWRDPVGAPLIINGVLQR